MMKAETAGRILVPLLRSSLSASPRLARLQGRVINLINPDAPVSLQHHVKALWHMERIGMAMRGEGESVMPVTVEFVPSLECNFSCRVCTYRNWKEQTIAETGKRNMSYEVMTTLLDRLEEAGVRGVIFTGGGEPFKNPRLIDGLRYAASKDFEVGLFTNGSLLTPAKIEALTATEIGFIRVSFNSADAGNYLKFHGLRNLRIFERAARNIRLLAQALALSEISFGLGVIVNEVNVDYMHTVAEFARAVVTGEPPARIDYLAYRPVVNYGQIDTDLTRQIGPDVALKAMRNFERVKEILSGLPVVPILARDYFIDASEGKVELQRAYQGCPGSSWAGSVAYDGGFYLCSEHDGDPAYQLGNLLRSSLPEIWSSSRRKKVLRKIGSCPPTCKIHRTNLVLAALTSEGKLSGNEIREMQAFLEIIRRFGDPGGINFL